MRIVRNKSALHRRRRAFTLVELLLAAVVTALTAAAATAVAFATVNASMQTSEVRSVKMAGQFVVSRIGREIRGARGVGVITQNTITLWREDKSEDDVLNADELAVIRYDASRMQIIFEFMELPMGDPPGEVVTSTEFANIDSVAALMNTADLRSVVWGKAIETCSFLGYPELVETRVVQSSFTIGAGEDEVAFQSTASPRASADYLFFAETISPDGSLKGRLRRLHFSRWHGFGDVAGNLIQ